VYDINQNLLCLSFFLGGLNKTHSPKIHMHKINKEKGGI